MTPVDPGPRALMRRLREVMAGSQSAQERLDHITVLIASNMVAEVCSVYAARPGEILELYATEGLKREAVHKTRLKVGEGLVGLIAEEAEPLALSDAQAHPRFAYRPETGEEVYHSFLGVPILRGGHTLGVLVVQNEKTRTYSDEEVESLQTIAMVIAEMIATGELGDVSAVRENDPRNIHPHHARGTPLAEGIALGHAVLHEPRVTVNRIIAEDIATERDRLAAALEELRKSIDAMLLSPELTRGGEHRDVLEAYRMFAHDRGWVRKLTEAIETGLTAEAAVERVQSDARARMLRQTDPYLRERLHDLDDLARRLLRHLVGREERVTTDEFVRDTILVGRNMGPAELLDYDRSRLRGLVIEDTSATSHVTIVARALGVPSVGGFEGLVDVIEEGDPIIVDGETGDVYARPSTDVEAAYSDKIRFRARRQAQYAKLRGEPSKTADGVDVGLMINAGLLVDLPHLEQSGAAGIGLFRTELQFMIASRFPRLSEQTNHYRQVLEAAGDRPVVFRALDIGSDKVLPYLRRAKEDNPALGWRALRLALERPGLLRLQMRALLRASEGRHLRLMFPLVADAQEFIDARTLFEREQALAREHGYPEPARVSLGVMIEVPSLLWQLDRLLPTVDFASVGSNDLIQYLYASDRSDARLSDRYDPLSPATLRALAHIVERARAAGVPLSLCGELAGRPLESMALIGLGYESISMAPASIGPIKAMVRRLPVQRLRERLETLLDSPMQSVRPSLEAFAAEHDIPV